jgi:hypothetical protein
MVLHPGCRIGASQPNEPDDLRMDVGHVHVEDWLMMGDAVPESVDRPDKILDVLPAFSVLEVGEGNVDRRAPKRPVVWPEEV